MLKITAYAQAQQPKMNRLGNDLKDGWGLPRQTIYLKENQYKPLDGQIYTKIADYQNNFFEILAKIQQQQPDWLITNGWDNLPKIYNDPVKYTLDELIKDTANHYRRRHDPTLSMLLRQRYLIRRFAKDIGDNTMIKDWDIDITFKNPTDPVLKKFYDRNIFAAVAVTSTFNELF